MMILIDSPEPKKQIVEKPKITNAFKQMEEERLPLQEQNPGVIAWAKITGHNWWPGILNRIPSFLLYKKFAYLFLSINIYNIFVICFSIAMIIDYRDCCFKEPNFGCQWIMWYGDYTVSQVIYFSIILKLKNQYIKRLSIHEEFFLLLLRSYFTPSYRYIILHF